MKLKKIISSNFYYYQWLISTRKLRSGFLKIKILSFKETIDEIIRKKKSISRYGDGEFRLLFPEFALEFQENSPLISERLKEVLTSNLENHMVCLPEPLEKVSSFDIPTKHWWKKFINVYGLRISPYLSSKKVYGNQFITRFYIGYQNKSQKNILSTVSLLKKIWDQKDILVIEGKYSRLGVGNDLFSNAKSLKRIIAPPKNAFRVYDQLMDSAKEYGEDKLILIALGPTATILAYDLARVNYWALDVGHIDIEYMWFLKGATEKIAIEGRHVNEAEKQESFDIPKEFLEEYNNSIILEITE